MFDIETKTSDYMSVIVTHKCNLNCPFCVDCKRNDQSPFITMQDVALACKMGKRLGVRDILLVGGEPTLHPNIVEVVKEFAKSFRVIVTTNAWSEQSIETIYKIDSFVSSFNISYYGQANLPNPHRMIADVTLSSLIHAEKLNTKLSLDNFIDKYENDYNLKFSTLTICNEYTAKNQHVPYLDQLDSEYIVLFNEILGQIYRGHIIKRYDRVINSNAEQYYKFHVDGTLTKEW